MLSASAHSTAITKHSEGCFAIQIIFGLNVTRVPFPGRWEIDLTSVMEIESKRVLSGVVALFAI